MQTWLHQFKQNSKMTPFDDIDQTLKKIQMREKPMSYVVKVN